MYSTMGMCADRAVFSGCGTHTLRRRPDVQLRITEAWTLELPGVVWYVEVRSRQLDTQADQPRIVDRTSRTGTHITLPDTLR